MRDDFIHLHVHSAFSIIGGGVGASSLEALAAAAVERGATTLALTDTNGVYGAMDFRRVTRAYGLRPVYGVSLETETERAMVLPFDANGWATLCRAVTAKHCEDNYAVSRQLSADRAGVAVLTSDTRLLEQLARDTGTENLYAELVPASGRWRSRARTDCRRSRPTRCASRIPRITRATGCWRRSRATPPSRRSPPK
jgi:error-prone DNA polymerase